MAPSPTAPFPIDVNDVHVKHGYVCYTNTFKGLFCRVKINDDGTATGPLGTIFAGKATFDDFGMSRNGIPYVAGSNVLARV